MMPPWWRREPKASRAPWYLRVMDAASATLFPSLEPAGDEADKRMIRTRRVEGRSWVFAGSLPLGFALVALFIVTTVQFLRGEPIVLSGVLLLFGGIGLAFVGFGVLRLETARWGTTLMDRAREQGAELARMKAKKRSTSPEVARMVRTGIVSPEMARHLLGEEEELLFMPAEPPRKKMKGGRPIQANGHWDHDMRYVETGCPGCDKAIKEALK